MALKYKPTSLKDLTNYHINLYYLMLINNPGIRTNHDNHFNETEIIQRHYEKSLGETDWHTEQNKRLFKERINFLTNIYDKEEEVRDRRKRKKEIFGKYLEVKVS